MKILYHHRTLADGAEGVHIREMVGAFRALGHEVCVAALVGEGGNGRPGKSSRFWTTVRGAIPGAAYELAEIGYNWIAGPRVSRSAVQFCPSFIYDRYNTYSTAALSAARRARVPLLLEVNAPLAYERAAYPEIPLWFPGLAARCEQRICSQADHVFVVSTPLKQFLVSQRGIAESKVSVLPNGANPDKFDPKTDGSAVRRRRGLEGRTVVGFVGILRPWHGIDLLFRAFAAISSQRQALHLLIVGDGPQEDALRSESRRLGIGDRVTFCGRVPHHEMPAHIAAMDVAVSPRATFYASPMKILEYMAMGVPVVAPYMPNVQDLVEDGVDGLLFQPEDPGALARRLVELAENGELRRRIGQNGRTKIENRLNWANNAKRVVEQARAMGCCE